MQSCHNCSFNLHCFTPCPCSSLHLPMTLLCQNLLLDLSLFGVWIFYKCNCDIHVLLVQTEQVPLLWEVQIPPLKADTNQRAGQSACARFSLIKMLPLVTQNLQTSLSHLQGDFRVQGMTDRMWPVPYLCYKMPPEERCSTPRIPVWQAVSQLDSAWLKASKNKDTECLRTNYCKK